MATEKVTITKVNYTGNKKDGTPILSKFGKPSYKTGILTNEYGAAWINGFLPFQPDKWEGTTQELEIYDDEKWGKSFKLPPKNMGGLSQDDRTLLFKANEKAEAALAGYKWLKSALVEKGVIDLPGEKIPGTTVDYPKEKSIDPASITFDGIDPEMESLMQSAEEAMS